MIFGPITEALLASTYWDVGELISKVSTQILLTRASIRLCNFQII